MTPIEFRKLKDPSIQQCLKYLHLKITYPLFPDIVLRARIERIPEKHRKFCETQLKLEGLL